MPLRAGMHPQHRGVNSSLDMTVVIINVNYSTISQVKLKIINRRTGVQRLRCHGPGGLNLCANVFFQWQKMFFKQQLI